MARSVLAWQVLSGQTPWSAMRAVQNRDRGQGWAAERGPGGAPEKDLGQNEKNEKSEKSEKNEKNQKSLGGMVMGMGDFGMMRVVVAGGRPPIPYCQTREMLLPPTCHATAAPATAAAAAAATAPGPNTDTRLAQAPRLRDNAKPLWPPAVCDLIERCWAGDPSKRPSFENIVAELEDSKGRGAFGVASA